MPDCTGTCTKVFYYKIRVIGWTIRDKNGDITEKLTETTRDSVEKRVKKELEDLVEGKLVTPCAQQGCECKCKKPHRTDKEKRNAEDDFKKKRGGTDDEIVIHDYPLAGVPNSTPPFTLTIKFTGYGAVNVTGDCK